MSVTPKFGATGTYEVASPYSVESGTVYICKGIDSFQSLILRDIDIYTEYYATVGLAESDYKTDLANAENIITLYTEDGTSLFIPSSYITSAPTTTTVAYHDVYIVANVGALPDALDVDDILDSVKEIVDNNLGVTSTVSKAVSPLSQAVSYAQYQANETARLANVDYVYTLSQQITDQKTTIDSLRTQIEALQTVIVALQGS